MNTNSTDLPVWLQDFNGLSAASQMLFQEYHSRHRDTETVPSVFKKKKKKPPNFISRTSNELVIGILEWYCRNNGLVENAANQRLAALKAFSDYAQLNISSTSPLYRMSLDQGKGCTERSIFPDCGMMSSLINSPDVNSIPVSATGDPDTLVATVAEFLELCDITIADISLGSAATVRLHGKGKQYRTVDSRRTAKLFMKTILAGTKAHTL